MDLYQQEILEHFKHPHHHGKINDANITQKERNSSCGDELTFYLQVDGEKVVNVSFEGDGCAISQAAASMLTDEIIGKKLTEIKIFSKEKIIELLGIDLGPTRLKCALLSLQGIQQAIKKLPNIS
ncbi:MAG: SUF system NifU family Fe-S cluster assembly protein [Candidatus Kerfeldbacteria bacterium RIFOXYA2_FULL_38_24]|uniref:SUF system NifU family Fe-S cluster assembly protein n=1 Tax=Candidatus Kerfeldbacteria bacterium RIFOXYB2_FULL_38_14 TaxID=1798547 RepID=A0A1G2BGD3_9BACT|nr:MAG: SUF system NifU family Fe-S cluster assembly protein [Candidatus Kerfeldbacteria bacterium RIFOXYA2_FULL_38_24]OGY88115.1 MAG: SUF system NifU family Fe-S cluster assembly protein [Candidatus Kerfeldbacteria bacterium RIFOXYB2_FULL_38_14]OGY88732.1 MAG: SUF system NifU family Fe-S cluster assembly protein [Candidatus Kerfeldbacteria bacterium RIFOXYC2_FULL_38_9]